MCKCYLARYNPHAKGQEAGRQRQSSAWWCSIPSSSCWLHRRSSLFRGTNTVFHVFPCDLFRTSSTLQEYLTTFLLVVTCKIFRCKVELLFYFWELCWQCKREGWYYTQNTLYRTGLPIYSGTSQPGTCQFWLDNPRMKQLVLMANLKWHFY